MLRSQPSRSSKRAASQDLDDHSDSGHSSSSHSKAGRQKRRRLTIEETEYLISVFENTTQKPNAELRQELADKLNMTPRSIQIWFQNRRAKVKRDAQESEALEVNDKVFRSPSYPTPSPTVSPIPSAQRSSPSSSKLADTATTGQSAVTPGRFHPHMPVLVENADLERASFGMDHFFVNGSPDMSTAATSAATSDFLTSPLYASPLEFHSLSFNDPMLNSEMSTVPSLDQSQHNLLLAATTAGSSPLTFTSAPDCSSFSIPNTTAALTNQLPVITPSRFLSEFISKDQSSSVSSTLAFYNIPSQPPNSQSPDYSIPLSASLSTATSAMAMNNTVALGSGVGTSSTLFDDLMNLSRSYPNLMEDCVELFENDFNNAKGSTSEIVVAKQESESESPINSPLLQRQKPQLSINVPSSTEPDIPTPPSTAIPFTFHPDQSQISVVSVDQTSNNDDARSASSLHTMLDWL